MSTRMLGIFSLCQCFITVCSETEATYLMYLICRVVADLKILSEFKDD